MAFSSKDEKFTELSGKRENDTPRKSETSAIQDAAIERPCQEEDSDSDFEYRNILRQMKFEGGILYLNVGEFEQAMQHGSESVYDLRLMMVGHQGVGKTTITKGLLNDETPREQIISTDGIDVYIGWGQIDIETGAWETGGKVANDAYIKLGRILNECRRSRIRREGIESQECKKESRHKTKHSRHEHQADKKLELMAKKLDVAHFLNKAWDHEGDRSNTAPVQIWDFGGQVVFYTTHQTFLSVRCVYLLVFDLSKSLNEIINEIHFVPGQVAKLETIEFWVNSILAYTGGIYPGFPKILFVGTHLDEIPVEDRENKVSKVFDDIQSHFQNHLGSDHLVINPALCLNAKNPEDVGYDRLRSAIFEIATTQPFWGEKRPNSWIVLTEIIAKLKLSGTQYLTLTQIDILNKANQIRVMPDEELAECLKFQHLQGNILFFPEKSLRDFVILNPSWLIDALKSFFTAERFCKDDHAKEQMWMNATKKGILEKETINKVWQKEEYREYLNNKEYVLKAMERLDLITNPKLYSAEGEDAVMNYYFVPSMISNKLSQEAIINMIPCERSFCMAILPKQRFLPPAIFHRLTTSCLSMWPLLRVKNEDLLYSGFCGLRLDNFHRLFLQQSCDRIYIHICHTRDVRAVSLNLFHGLREFLMLTLNRVTDVYGQHQLEDGTERFNIQIPCCTQHPECYLTSKESLLTACRHDDCNNNQMLLFQMQGVKESNYIVKTECLSSCKGLDKKIMKQRPTDQDLCRLSRYLISSPDILGVALDVPQGMIDKIKSCPYYQKHEQNFCLLIYWRDRRKETFETLIEALKLTQDTNEHTFCQMHKTDGPCSNHDMTKDIFMKKPSIQHLNSLADRLTPSVAFHLGIELLLTFPEIERIRSDFPNKSLQQTREILYKWRNMPNIQATYGALYIALQHIGSSESLQEILNQKSIDDEI